MKEPLDSAQELLEKAAEDLALPPRVALLSLAT